jgi:hypothetical protein
VKCTLDKRPSIVISGKPIFSSERMLHKDYYHKSSVEKKIRTITTRVQLKKKYLVMSLKGLDAKRKLIGGKLPVIK